MSVHRVGGLRGQEHRRPCQLLRLQPPVGRSMRGAEDPHSLTYVQNGILAAVLLNGGAADYVITGCGTGEGAMLACNSFPSTALRISPSVQLS